MKKIRIVQVNECAFIVQELGTFLFFPKWWTWQTWCLDSSWDKVYPSVRDAMDSISRALEDRKKEGYAKNFPRKVVWEDG